MSAERYAPRSGIESTNAGLKNRLGLGRLRVRERGSVFRVILHKVTDWKGTCVSSFEEVARFGKRSSGSDPESGATGLNGRFFPQPFCGKQGFFTMGSLGAMPVFIVFEPQTSPETNAPNATIEFCR